MGKESLVWIRKPNEKEQRIMNECPVWEHEKGVWPAHYDEREESFLIIEGKGSITTEDGTIYRFESGDFVTCKPNFDCIWEVYTDIIKKHYVFNMELKD